MSEGTRWTKEQLDAITARECNLLVAAAAGAGKTAVLVERIIRRIIDLDSAIDIDRLLVVTFTNAAATEMKERIGNALEKALEKKPESQVLQRQMALLNRASIITIHSFCLEVIRNNFHYVDLDPHFRIANETEALLMKLEALGEMFEERYMEDNPDSRFLDLVECYGGNRDDQELQDMVFQLHNFVQSHPWPKEWLKEHIESFNIPEGTDLGDNPWGRVLMDNLKVDATGWLEAMERAIHIIHNSEGLEPYLENFTKEASMIKEILHCCDGSWDDLYTVFSKMEFDRLSRCGKDADKNRQKQVKDIRDGIKYQIGKMQQEFFACTSRQVAQDLRLMKPRIECLSELVLELEERYWAKKKQMSLLDFNDLEHLCLEILLEQGEEGERKPSKVALELQDRFIEVLVDEYQDSNLVQEVILSAVSRKNTEKPNMFMVGDVKQSIYRFRQARPELFMGKYISYSQDPGSPNRKIKLFKNFRSRKQVIHGVNFIFKQIMSRNVGELDYDDGEALDPGAVFLENKALEDAHDLELHIIDMEDESPVAREEREQTADDGLEMDEELGSIQVEARLVARRIEELLSYHRPDKAMQVYDRGKGGYRNIEYRDIVILLRTNKNWTEPFLQELAAWGIPVYADTGTGYFETIEVQTVLSLLQIIDNPLQDIPLLAVLRSPIVAWTPEDLIDIRLIDRESTFYEALVKTAEKGDERLANQARKFIDSLETWRDKALYMSTDELIWYLYGQTGYYSCVGAMPGGIQRQANLRILFERARQYEETSYKGLFNFINFINRLKTSQGDMGSAKILGENQNVVRIMSIHKSKGLEFPVVFVAGCGKQFNFMDTTRSILFHQDLGLGPDYVDHEKRIIYPTLPKQALKKKIRVETLSEEMRILYVALTRAREKLIITGAIKNMEKAAQGWADALEVEGTKLPEYQILKGMRYLDWIGPGVIRHKQGKALRLIAGLSQEDKKYPGLLQDDSKWCVQLWNKRDGMMIPEIVEDSAAGLDWLWEIDEEENTYHQEIHRILDWEYPYMKACKLPVKVSVTELKHQLQARISEEGTPAPIPPLVKKPAFLEGKKTISAAERGSLLHFVLQHLNFGRVRSRQEILGQVRGMIDAELITEEQAKAIDIHRIDRFLRSPLGNRMLNAPQIHREVPFTIQLGSTELYPEISGELHGEDTIVLQGIIDCYFEEDGYIVLVDYKTDYVPQDGGEALIRERYGSQIEYYTYALERITGKKVKGKYIYLFWNGQILEY